MQDEAAELQGSPDLAKELDWSPASNKAIQTNTSVFPELGQSPETPTHQPAACLEDAEGDDRSCPKSFVTSQCYLCMNMKSFLAETWARNSGLPLPNFCQAVD